MPKQCEHGKNKRKCITCSPWKCEACDKVMLKDTKRRHLKSKKHMGIPVVEIQAEPMPDVEAKAEPMPDVEAKAEPMPDVEAHIEIQAPVIPKRKKRKVKAKAEPVPAMVSPLAEPMPAVEVKDEPLYEVIDVPSRQLDDDAKKQRRAKRDALAKHKVEMEAKERDAKKDALVKAMDAEARRIKKRDAQRARRLDPEKRKQDNEARKARRLRALAKKENDSSGDTPRPVLAVVDHGS